MLVILRENIEHLGHTGEIVRVADGYARNYLLPLNLVAVAEEKNRLALEHLQRGLEKKRQAQRATAVALAERLKNLQISLARKVGEQGKLFGSVTNADIAAALAQQDILIDRKAIHLEVPIRSTGSFMVDVKLERDVHARLQIQVTEEKSS